MSAHASPPDDPSNEDGVNIRKIVLVGVVSLGIFALSAVIALVMLRTDLARLRETEGVPPPPRALGEAEIGIVDQIEFQADRRLDDWRAAKQKRLGSYGWVDRSKGVIHIPIDKAIDEVVSGTTQ